MQSSWYHDYSTTLSTTQLPGATVNYSLRGSGITALNDQKGSIFIDWNNDHDFNDLGEEVVSNILMPYNTNIIGTFDVPLLQSNGNYRMRVASQYSLYPNPIDPCFVFYGEVEDYTIIISTGCSSPTLPTINASSTTNCGTESTTLSIATGTLNDATNWKWYSGSCNGTNVGTGISINISPTSTTTYFVRGEGGCVTPGSCASQTITVNPLLNWYIDADNDGSYTIVPIVSCSSPGVGYFTASSPGNDCDDTRNFVHPGATEICNGIDDNCNGQIDETCCAINLSGTVTTVKCKGFNTGAINVTSSNIYGSPTYIWSNTNTNEDLSNLFASTYTVTVTYFAGCSASASFIVTQPATVLGINLAKVTIRCAGKSSGQITALPTGGVPPYSYLWSTGETTAKIVGLPANNYTVTITDFEGCVKTKTTIMTQNPTILVVITPSPGFATAQVDGGVSPYSYAWNTLPNQTTDMATGLLSGHTYRLKVTDSKGCTKITSIQMPTTKISENESSYCDMQMSVFPNPTKGIIQLIFESLYNSAFTISFTDVTGRIVLSENKMTSKGTNTFEFDLSNLSKGIYLLQLKSETQQSNAKVIRE